MAMPQRLSCALVPILEKKRVTPMDTSASVKCTFHGSDYTIDFPFANHFVLVNRTTGEKQTIRRRAQQAKSPVASTGGIDEKQRQEQEHELWKQEVERRRQEEDQRRR